MIPFILAAIGGAFIGNAITDNKKNKEVVEEPIHEDIKKEEPIKEESYVEEKEPENKEEDSKFEEEQPENIDGENYVDEQEPENIEDENEPEHEESRVKEEEPKHESETTLEGDNFADGGDIPNNYEGKSAEEVWNEWTLEQKTNFLKDHWWAKPESLLSSKIKDIEKSTYDELPAAIKQELGSHTRHGEYKNGGELSECDNRLSGDKYLDKEYYKTFSLQGNGNRQYNIFQSHSDSQLRQAANKLFPNMAYQEHLSRAKYFSEKTKDALDKYIETVTIKFKKEFNRDIEPTDYKVSGIWSSDFSESSKSEIRKELDKYSEYKAATYLHNSFLRNADKAKIYKDGGDIDESGGNVSKFKNMSERQYLKDHFFQSIFPENENPNEYFEFKKMASSNDEKINNFISELKRDGYTVRRQSSSDFVSVQGVKRKNKMATGGDVGNIAKVLIISSKKPLSTQLHKETGDGWNAIDYDEEKTGTYDFVVRHKESGKTFIVFTENYYSQVDKNVIKDDLSYIVTNKIFGIEGYEFADGGGLPDVLEEKIYSWWWDLSKKERSDLCLKYPDLKIESIYEAEHPKGNNYEDGGEIEGLNAYEFAYLYIKKGITQPYREEYLKPIGLWKTEKAKDVEKSLINLGLLNSAGSINELGKSVAKKIDLYIDYGFSGGYLGTMTNNRLASFKSNVESKFVNKKMADGVALEDKKIPIKSVTLESNSGVLVSDASVSKANEALYYFWKRNKHSDVYYDITFEDGETLEGSIDLEPHSFHEDHKHNILTWHINTFWNNVAKSDYSYIPKEDKEEAIKLVNNYRLYSDGGKVDGFNIVYERSSKMMGGNGVSGTIRTKPQNYYVATIDKNGEILFEGIESMTKDIDKDKVKKLWNEKKIVDITPEKYYDSRDSYADGGAVGGHKEVCIRSKGQGVFKSWAILNADSPFSYASEVEFDTDEKAKDYATNKGWDVVKEFNENYSNKDASKDYEIVVVFKELEKDGGERHWDRYLVNAISVEEAKEWSAKHWKEEFDNSDLCFIEALTDAEYRDKYLKMEAGGGIGKMNWKKHKEILDFEKEIKKRDKNNRIEDVILNNDNDFVVYYIDNSGTITSRNTKVIEKYSKGGKTWIQDAIKDKGALRKTAKRKGLIKGDEKLSMADIKKLEKEGGKTAKRAHLAETLVKVRKHNPHQDKLKKVMAYAKETRKEGEAWKQAVARAWKEVE